MLKLSIYKQILLFVIFVLNIFNGFFRYYFIVNFLNAESFILERNTINLKYPSSVASLITSLSSDPRWLSNVYYLSIAIISTYASCRIIFGKQKAQLSVICYLILFGFCGLFMLLSVITGSYKIGFAIAQELKNMAQSPIISFVIIGLLYFSTMDRKSASE